MTVRAAQQTCVLSTVPHSPFSAQPASTVCTWFLSASSKAETPPPSLPPLGTLLSASDSSPLSPAISCSCSFTKEASPVPPPPAAATEARPAPPPPPPPSSPPEEAVVVVPPLFSTAGGTLSPSVKIEITRRLTSSDAFTSNELKPASCRRSLNENVVQKCVGFGLVRAGNASSNQTRTVAPVESMRAAYATPEEAITRLRRIVLYKERVFRMSPPCTKDDNTFRVRKKTPLGIHAMTSCVLPSSTLSPSPPLSLYMSLCLSLAVCLSLSPSVSLS